MASFQSELDKLNTKIVALDPTSSKDPVIVAKTLVDLRRLEAEFRLLEASIVTYTNSRPIVVSHPDATVARPDEDECTILHAKLCTEVKSTHAYLQGKVVRYTNRAASDRSTGKA
jgi:hypothetical protein